MHPFLGSRNYHRMHAPVGGTVLETKLVEGQIYLKVIVDENGKLQPIRKIGRKKPSILNTPNTAGYQFLHMRRLVVLETKIGLVAVLRIGMAQVSSVILLRTVEPCSKGRNLLVSNLMDLIS